MMLSLTRKGLKDIYEHIPVLFINVSHFVSSTSQLLVIPNYLILVIDVYQAWCGPCKAVLNLFRKLKTEFDDDDVLHFAVVRMSILYGTLLTFYIKYIFISAYTELSYLMCDIDFGLISSSSAYFLLRLCLEAY